MREILFRGKAINRDKREYRTDYKNGDWVYGLFMKKYDDRFKNLPAEMSNEYGVTGIEVDYKTISEYTGLTDKNGNKIFEGDILKYTRTNCHNVYEKEFEDSFKGGDLVTYLEIYYDDTCAAFRHRLYDENKKLFGSGFLSFQDARADENIIEVIGNIYDDPELLNK